MISRYVGNAEQLAFLADACKKLDEVTQTNKEDKSFMYLGKIEIRSEGQVVGFLEDWDGLGYAYHALDESFEVVQP